ncbi:MAG TPA: DUF6578 domain-containing protein [Gaiellaceae bacterium]|nr:DUF6578 domain-containing protein [Gaiellaceae bacterium]
MTPWLAGWEWDCCGDDFGDGDDVVWQLLPVLPETQAWVERVFNPVISARLTHQETHHDLPEAKLAQPTEGKVTAIESAFYIGAMDDNVVKPVHGSGFVEPRGAVAGFDPRACEWPDGLHHEGYIVRLGR